MEEEAKVGLLKNGSRIIVIVGGGHSITVLNAHQQPAFAADLLCAWYWSRCLTLFRISTPRAQI